jgi:DNA-binding MarR family transcriptional regulator
MTTDVQTLGRIIKKTQYRHHRMLDTELASVGTTLVQWDALRAIAQNPGSSAHQLALETFQSDQAFGTLANRLVAQELIERRSGHGRRIEHHLTVTGENTLEAGRSITQKVLSMSFAKLTDKERTMLSELLTRLDS